MRESRTTHDAAKTAVPSTRATREFLRKGAFANSSERGVVAIFSILARLATTETWELEGVGLTSLLERLSSPVWAAWVCGASPARGGGEDCACRERQRV